MAKRNDQDFRTPATMTNLALSFRGQPTLRAFVRQLQTPGSKITIFCGAGVSVDSGLPVWRSLVSRLASRIENPDLREMIRADEATLTRKVGLILQLIMDEGESEESLIAKTLYAPTDDGLPSGQLAAAIAQLAVTLGPERVRIATTNYDDRLEFALQKLGAEIEPMGLNEADQWARGSFGPGSFKVLHLHGYLAKIGSDHKVPIVLSESQYLREGKRVQDHVRRMLLSSSATVFVGVSMTDPNIVEPLGELGAAKSGHDLYTVLVPDSASLPGEDPPGRRAHAYTVMLKNYLNREFGVQSIVLKSYAQVAQCMLEASVAASDPSNYNSDDPSNSVRYGFRFQRVLRRIHAALHISGGMEAPSGDHASALSEQLYESLRVDGGPVSFVKDFITRTTVEEFERMGISEQHLRDEDFALTLWLRAMREESDDSPCPYKVLQVGTSAYVQRNGKSFTRYHWVTGDATFVAPKCVYLGRSSIEVLDVSREKDADRPTWRSFLGTPLVLTERDLGVGTLTEFKLTVGAVVLYSTRRIVRLKKLQEARASALDIEWLYRPSAMSLMTTEEQEELLSAIGQAGKRAVQRLARQ